MTENGDTDFAQAKSIFGRVKQNFNVLFQMYFGEEILSYIHPSLEERIKRIEAMCDE